MIGSIYLYYKVHCYNKMKLRNLIFTLVKCWSTTKTITLHGKGLTVSKDSVEVLYKPTSVETTFRSLKKKNYNDQQKIIDLKFDDENEFIVMTLEKPLQKQKHYILKIPFNGQISDSMIGLTKLKYDRKIIIASDFKRTYARRVFPCFDDPRMRGRFRLTIERREEAISFSNTELQHSNVKEEDNKWIVDIYEEIASAPTYLISFVVFEDGATIKPKGTDKIRLWCHLASEGCSQAHNLLKEVFKTILDTSESFGLTKYLDKKLDYIILPGSSNVNVEKPGLIMKSENELLGNKDSKYLMLESFVKQLINMAVSPNEWSSQWLVTCLARYISITFLSRVDYEDLNYEEQQHSMFYIMMTHSQKLSVMKWDSKNEIKAVDNIAIVHKSLSTNVILEQEDSPQKLEKGLLILFMFLGVVGQDGFDTAVRQFFTKFDPFKSNHHPLFSDALYQFCYEIDKMRTYRPLHSHYRNRPIELTPEGLLSHDLMHNWVHKPGYPLIYVRRSEEVVTITQKQFFSRRPYKEDKKREKCWWIFLTYVTAADEVRVRKYGEKPPPAKWLGCEENANPSLMVMVDKTDWIAFKSRLSVPGLFRVDYDLKNWLLLAEALNNIAEYEKIPAVSRAQLVDDVLTFAYFGGGDVDFEIAFRLVHYLKHEDSNLKLMIWMSFFEGFDRFTQAYKGSEVVREMLKEFLQQVLENTYSAIFPDEESVTINIEEDDRKLSPIVLRIHQESCNSGVPQCRLHSSTIFSTWKSKQFHLEPPVSTYSKQLRQSVLCAAVRETSDKSDITFIFDSLKDHKIDRELLVEALKCPEKRNLIEMVLKYCTTETSNEVIEEKIAIFKGLLRENDAMILSGTYLFSNYDKINSYFSSWAKEKGHNPVDDFVEILACELSPSQLNELHKNNPDETKNIRDQLKNIELNQCKDYQRDHEWAKMNELLVDDALRKVLEIPPRKRPLGT